MRLNSSIFFYFEAFSSKIAVQGDCSKAGTPGF